MSEILGDYAGYIAHAEGMIRQQGVARSEIEHGGRLISIFQAESALEAGNWRVPRIELLQPKPTRENIDGIDGIFFVTAVSLPEFLRRHEDNSFDTKGLSNEANPYIELKRDGVTVKFHDRHWAPCSKSNGYLKQDKLKSPSRAFHV